MYDGDFWEGDIDEEVGFLGEQYSPSRWTAGGEGPTGNYDDYADDEEDFDGEEDFADTEVSIYGSADPLFTEVPFTPLGGSLEEQVSRVTPDPTVIPTAIF